MSLVVQDIVDEARDLSPVFDLARTPDRALVRHLTTYQNTLASAVALANPDALLVVLGTFNAPIAVWPTTNTLTPYLVIRGGTVTFTGGEPPDQPLHITTFEQRYKYPPGYGAYTMDETHIVFTGLSADIWNSVATVTVWGVALPTPIPQDETAMTTVLYPALPDQARGTYVARLAAFLAVRAAGHPSTPDAARPDVQMFAGQAEEAHDSFLRMMAMQRVWRAFTPASK